MHWIDLDHLPVLDGPRLDGIMHRLLTDPRRGTDGLIPNVIRSDPYAATPKPASLRAGFGVATQGCRAAYPSYDPWIAASQALLAMTRDGPAKRSEQKAVGMMLLGGVEVPVPPHLGAALHASLALVTPKNTGKPPKTPKGNHGSPHPKAAA